MLVHLTVWACLAIFLVSFIGFLSSLVLSLAKTKALSREPDDAKLSYWERAARANTCSSGIFLRPDLRSLCYLLFASIVGCYGSLAALSAIMSIFGERG